MEALRAAVKGCTSGPQLVAALENAAGVANGPIPGLVAAVIGEAKGGAPAAANGTAAANGAAAAPAAAAPAERKSLSDALCVVEGLMFLSPRGKQVLALYPDCLLVRTPKADVAVPWGAIKHVAIIDCIPGDTKGKVLLYLHVDGEAQVMNGKTHLTAVVIQTTAEAQLDVAHPQGAAGQRLQGPAPVVLCQALGAVPGGPAPSCFISPDPQFFQSADKAAGVKAHVKARDGFLYPLPSALCFLEAPQLFLPHSAIASLELMRAGGASATFDLVVHLKQKGAKPVEFGMIGRGEISAIEDYIGKCRLTVGVEESSGEEEEGGASRGGKEAAADAEEAEDSDDREDEDWAASSSSDEEGEEEEEQQGGERVQQAASGSSKRKREEGEAGEGEEEEEEEEEESGEEESSSDEEGSVELVSEDDFSTGQLRSMIASEGGSSGAGRPKRQRT